MWQTEPVDAVIWDMDGVLADSEPLWRAAMIEGFGAVGLHLSEADCRDTMGLRMDEVVDHWWSERPWGAPGPTGVCRTIVDRTCELIRERCEAMPGVVAGIGRIADLGLVQAIATSSPPQVIDAVLDATGLRGAFAVVHSADDEAYGKPHPGVYLTTADRLSVDPTRCLAIEDSLNGVVSAKAARMRCLAVPEPGLRDDPRFAMADAVVDALTQLSDAEWRTLLA